MSRSRVRGPHFWRVSVGGLPAAFSIDSSWSSRAVGERFVSIFAAALRNGDCSIGPTGSVSMILLNARRFVLGSWCSDSFAFLRCSWRLPTFEPSAM